LLASTLLGKKRKKVLGPRLAFITCIEGNRRSAPKSIIEVNDLRPRIDVMAEQVTHLEVTTEQARRNAISKVQEAEPEASQGLGKRVCFIAQLERE
jgi:hypothetical protein